MNPSRIYSFPFSADAGARVLILGTMPGEESLKQRQYYAHPRNLFWDLMGDLFGAVRELPYVQRLEILRAHRVALWDVAHSCRRQGSLDTAMTFVLANDFSSLFTVAPRIHTVFFNGQKAATLFRQLVQPTLTRHLELITLPSTSPAHASLQPFRKKQAWAQLQTVLAE